LRLIGPTRPPAGPADGLAGARPSRPDGRTPDTGTRPPLAGASLAGCKVLLVEDLASRALDLERSLRRLGHTVLGPAGSAAEAAALLRRERPNLALLDAVLLDGGTVPLARRLVASEVPFALVGGRDHGLLDRPPLRGTPRLPEPRTLPRLRAVVRQLHRLDLTRSLALTERDIARAWESITAQARIVGGLAAGGRDVRRAEELLQAHERTLATLEARRDRLRRELERQGGPACWPDWLGLSPDAA
jgi:CheY-like chemotaxis protein